MKEEGIELPVKSASTVVWEIIKETIENFPDAFTAYKHPEDLKVFSKKYHIHLQNFEVCRALSKNRCEIARFVIDLIQNKFVFHNDKQKKQSFKEVMQQTKKAFELTKVSYPYKKETDGYRFRLSYDGKIYHKKEELISLPNLMKSKNSLTQEAQDALAWIINYAWTDERSGYINLKGYKFVLLGGTAELSPIKALLHAGADVLTTNTGQIDKTIASLGEFSGTLYYSPSGMNLLTQPLEIAKTIEEFAGSEKVHVGIFAYKGGKGREWKLTTAMDGIIRVIKSKTASVCYYPSPSVITEVSSEVVKNIPSPHVLNVWQKAMRLSSLKAWYNPNIREEDNRFWVQSICSFQGCSYAAANLFGKYYPAEVYHHEQLRISANTGPVTATSSMDTPFLRAAFKEARRFSFHIFEGNETREILQALWLYDILNNEKATALFAKQVHGGIYTSPWLLNGIVEEAAVIGNIKRFFGLGEKVYLQHWLQKLQKGCENQVVYVKTPTRLEYILRRLSGDLASAFCGSSNGKVVSNLFLGNTPTIPKNIAKLIPFIAKSNRLPLLGKWTSKWARNKKIHGNLLTTILWSQRAKNERISLSTTTEGHLYRVRIHKNTGQDLEFFLTPDNIIQQTLYFGRALGDNSDKITIEYKYNKKNGTLQTTGPTAVQQNAFSKVLLKPHQLNSKLSSEFERLTHQSATNSVTFFVNSGILAEALDKLNDPQWQVDFTRVTVYSVHFVKKAKITEIENKIMETSIQPVKLTAVDKGEIIDNQISMSIDNTCINEVNISLLIRGNIQKNSTEKIPHLEYNNLKSTGIAIDLFSMSHIDLIDFAALNGDHNPLHQIKGAALMVGFKDIINPGLGSFTQIESCIRKHLNKDLSELCGTIVRPVYPGAKYILECKEEQSCQWKYQLVEEKNNKVIIDGSFVLE